MKISKKSGFTLIELMIVIAIIGIMVSIAVVNFGRNPDRDVRLEKDKLVTFLRNVQNKALTAEKVSGASGKVCGFGIREVSDSEIRTYYANTAGASPQDEACASHVNDSGTDYAENIFHPANNVTVNLPDSADKIFFLIPNGSIYYNGSLLSSDVQINLIKTGLSSSIPVTITPGGIIK